MKNPRTKFWSHWLVTAMCAHMAVLSGCGQNKTSSSIGVASINMPAGKTEMPNGELVAPECVRVPDAQAKTNIAETSTQVSFILDPSSDAAVVETAALDTFGQQLSSKRLCTSKPGSVLLELPNRAQRISILARETNSNRIYSLENIPVSPGLRINYGKIRGSVSASFKGTLTSQNPTTVEGKIEQLGWSIRVSASGEWSSGALPVGYWSLSLIDKEERKARLARMLLGTEDVQVEPFSLQKGDNSFVPLWSGTLQKSTAVFLAHADLDASEMRVSTDSNFLNAFWMPFRQIVSVPLSVSGKQQVFAQYRTLNGTESAILVSEFTANILNLNATAGATLQDPLVGVEKPETTLTTSPPQGATEHSVTIDVENLPRTWLPVTTPLQVKLRGTSESCGRRTLFVKFRDAEGRESASLQKILEVRCWEKNIPASPLSARYDHAAVPLTLSTEANAESDAVMIWGGRNNTTALNDGAIFKKVGDAWVWQMLPPPPVELTARTKPQLVVGRDYILVWGGEDLSGNPVPGWAFYDYRTNQWLAQSTTNNIFSGTPPPALKNAAVAYIKILNNDRNEGAFLVIGGENPSAAPLNAISNKYYALIESPDGLYPLWIEFNLKRAVARANFARSAHPGVVALHSGISTPSGMPTTTQPDASGDAPELSGDVQMFSFYYDAISATPSFKFANYIYKGTDSRTGALNGHVMIQTRLESTNPSIAELFESQIMCVYGAQPYGDELPNRCALEPFCRRVNDAYFFAPIGRLGVCFQPTGTLDTDSDIGYLKNYYMSVSTAPAARRLSPRSSAGLSSFSMNAALFYWSGVAPAGGEYLSSGGVFYSSADRWIPTTLFESPIPRNAHSAVYMLKHKRVFIWGGLTFQGPSSEGAFYVLP